MKMDYWDLPTQEFKKERWVSVTRLEGFHAFCVEHWTDTRTGCYLQEKIFIEGLK